MAAVKPFRCVRPAEKLADRVAALPYDVYNRSEARQVVEGDPVSFLAIDRADAWFPDQVGSYEDCVYEKARELLEERISDGTFVEDEEECFYLYELTMGGRSQTGIVGCSSVDDYLEDVIKKHENTRADKELDRIRHIDVLDAQTGPIFLTYHPVKRLKEIVAGAKKGAPLYNFAGEDGVRHRVWKVEKPEEVEGIRKAFDAVPATYIADGHHRAASAVKVALKRREENPGYEKEAEFNYFLSVLFPADELEILPYNRVVKDLAGLSRDEFIRAVSGNFHKREVGAEPYAPDCRGHFGMYLDGCWYELWPKGGLTSDDPVKGLDVSVLQDLLLDPVLKIRDPKTDKRIGFVGGIRGLEELRRRTESDMKVAFSMYPTSMEELLTVADAGLLMPPKSTWFEPKLRSGLFIHKLG